MKHVITPSIFLVSVLLSTACTEADDADVEEGAPPEVAACCAPEPPRGGEPLYDAFDLGGQARERFELLRRLNRPGR